MEYTKHLDNEKELVIIETAGSLTYEIFPIIINEIISLLKESKYSKVLVNHENATVAPLSEQDLMNIARDCILMNDY